MLGPPSSESWRLIQSVSLSPAAQGIMLVYDITNEKSFDNIRNRTRNIDEGRPANLARCPLLCPHPQAPWFTQEPLGMEAARGNSPGTESGEQEPTQSTLETMLAWLHHRAAPRAHFPSWAVAFE